MSLLNLVGFESGTLDDLIENDNVVGGMAISSDIKRTGAYSLRCEMTTTAAGYVGIKKHDTIQIQDLNLDNVWCRFYFYIATLPSADSEEFAGCLGSASLKFHLRVTSTGKIQAYNKTGTVQLGSDGTSILSTGTWYRIDMKVGKGANAAYEVRLNGEVELSGTGDLNTTQNDRLCLGKITNRNGESVDFFYDDVAIDDADYPADGAIAILKANGDGTYTTWTVGAGGGDDWTNVDEVPYDSDTTYLLSTQVQGEASTVTLEDSSGAGISGTINAVKGLFLFKTHTPGGSVQARIRGSGTDSDTGSVVIGAAYSTLGLLLEDDPGTGSPWTIGGIDGAEVGAEERDVDDKTRMTAAYLMVDYDESGGGAAVPGPKIQVI